MSSPRKPFHEIALESFGVLTQNFVLAYPLLLFSLLLSVVMPKTYQPSLEEPRWWVLGAGIFLIQCAVMAGTFSMLAEAVRIHYYRLVNPPIPENLESIEDIEIPNPLEDFVALLKEFFPGVSRYFINFILGTLVQVGVLVAIYLWFSHAIAQTGGEPAFLKQLTDMQTASEEPVQVDTTTMFMALNPVEQAHFVNYMKLFFGGIGLYGLFYFLTIFWQAFVVMQDKPFWTAYWESLKQCVTRPVVFFGIVLLFVGLTMGLFFLPQVGGTMFLALAYFLMILLQIYFALVTVMVVADSSQLELSIAKRKPEKQLDQVG